MPGWSLAANPSAIWDAGEVASELKTVLSKLDLIGLTTTLSDKKRQFVWVQRGLTQEEAVSMIVNGFCKEVMQNLPMEFAVEAQKLLGISLEGSVG